MTSVIRTHGLTKVYHTGAARSRRAASGQLRPDAEAQPGPPGAGKWGRAASRRLRPGAEAQPRRAGTPQVRAQRGVDLVVGAGEMIAVMGASGSGKSTLMNILGCLDAPTAGSYELDGIPTGGLTRDQLADLRNHKIGFVFQGFNLLARTTALDSVALPLLYDRSGRVRDARAAAAAALARVGLADRAHHQPSELSGGQQQRVAIARALITQPTLLLADAPTGNLDSRTSIEIMALFQELNQQGLTILLVTHEPDIARYAKRIVDMRDGRIIRDQPVTDRRSAAADLAAEPVEPVAVEEAA
ncbi:MAG: ATP-binding cassette domain-containing protein [Gemmatimonadetes bacterium]|nr:ATP-binding cassette domain-containing protein [Gemmatimonadota bacterium]